MIRLWAIGGAAVLALCIALSVGLYMAMTSAQKKVTALEIDRERLEQAIEAHKLVEAGLKDATAELEREAKDSKSREEMLELILAEIRRAPKSDNGEIAKVLERALRRIDADRMRRDAAPHRPPRPLRH